jgi:hypothetical protein
MTKINEARLIINANPELAKEWHCEKNGDLTPHNITIGSGKKVWWKCSKNPEHVWEAKVLNRGKGNGCPFCSGKRSTNTNNLAVQNAPLSKEWHPTKNKDLTPFDVTSGSSKKVWWQCPSVESHSWKTTIASRNKGGHGCPKCSGRISSVEKSLEVLNPELTKEWHPTKNKKTPSEFTVNSGKKVWWQCSENPAHEWEAVIASRNRGHGCPECGRQQALDTRSEQYKHKSLSALFPRLLEEWDYTKNQDFSPELLSAASHAKVWWICSEDPSHQWKTLIVTRTNGSQCPYCIGRVASKETSLGALNPVLAKEWHPKKNKELTPEDVRPNTGLKVWWQCSLHPDHEWQAQISNRNRRGDSCPHCHSRTSFYEQTVYYFLRKVFPNTTNQEMIKNDDDTKREVDIYIPELSLGIEYDGYYYHKLRMKHDKDKNKYMNENGVQLIRIREEPLEVLSTNNCINFKTGANNFARLEEAIRSVIGFILDKYTLSNETIAQLSNLKKNISIDDDLSNIYEGYLFAKQKNNLEEKFPDIAEEWHPTKNKNLKPSQVSYSSNKKVWWLCPKGHPYDRPVNTRTLNNRKGGCPYCAGKRVNDDNSLSSQKPSLAKEWHPIKNGSLTPNDVIAGSHKKVWWLCSKKPDHEWEAVIESRGRGNGCPYCAGRKINHTNSLESINPEAAKLWHPTKNGDMAPSQVAPNTHKRVWWQCKEDQNHEWEAYISNIHRGRSCPVCSKKTRAEKIVATRRATLLKELKESAAKKGFTLISTSYLGSREKHLFKCKNNHESKHSPRMFKENNPQCTHCVNK